MTRDGISLFGDKEARRILKALGPKWREIVRDETAATSLDIEGKAKADVAKNFNRLGTAIRVRTARDGLEADIGVFEPPPGAGGENYAPFVEKGRKPGRMPPIEPLRLWSARKLGDPDAAFLVARKIAAKGTPAQPFLEPAHDAFAPRYPRNVARKLRAALP